MRSKYIILFIISMVLLAHGASLQANGYRGYVDFLDPALQKKIQEALRDKGYNPGPIDGKFGPKSKAALKAFEEEHGIDSDGVLTPELSKSLLNIDISVGDSKDLESEEELNLLRQLGLVPTNTHWGKEEGYVFPD